MIIFILMLVDTLQDVQHVSELGFPFTEVMLTLSG